MKVTFAKKLYQVIDQTMFTPFEHELTDGKKCLAYSVSQPGEIPFSAAYITQTATSDEFGDDNSFMNEVVEAFMDAQILITGYHTVVYFPPVPFMPTDEG